MTLDTDTLLIIVAGIAALEQVLAGSDAIKSNSTFQLICNLTNSFMNLFKKTP